MAEIPPLRPSRTPARSYYDEPAYLTDEEVVAWTPPPKLTPEELRRMVEEDDGALSVGASMGEGWTCARCGVMGRPEDMVSHPDGRATCKDC